jgi:hypothetical protein
MSEFKLANTPLTRPNDAPSELTKIITRCCSACLRPCQFPNDILEVYREVRSVVISKIDLKELMNENARIPPSPKIVGVAYHRTGAKHHGNVTTFRKTVDVAYGSWQEEAEPIAFNDGPIVAYVCSHGYVFEPSMDKALIQILDAVEIQIRGYDKLYSVYEGGLHIGVSERAIAADENDAFVARCKSPFVACFLWEVAFLLGYNAIIENIWRAKTTLIVQESRKVISADEKLRAPAGKRDPSVFAFRDTAISMNVENFP